MSNGRSHARWLFVVSLALSTGPWMSAQQIFGVGPYDASHGFGSTAFALTPTYWPPAPEPAPAKEPLVSADYLRHPLSHKAQRFLQKIDQIAKQGRHSDALVQLRAGLSQFRGDAPYLYNMIGAESVEVKDYATAKDAFARVLEAMPHLSVNHSNYGLSLIGLGETDAGERYLRTAVALDDTNENAKAILEIVEKAQARAAADGTSVKFVPNIEATNGAATAK